MHTHVPIPCAQAHPPIPSPGCANMPAHPRCASTPRPSHVCKHTAHQPQAYEHNRLPTCHVHACSPAHVVCANRPRYACDRKYPQPMPATTSDWASNIQASRRHCVESTCLNHHRRHRGHCRHRHHHHHCQRLASVAIITVIINMGLRARARVHTTFQARSEKQ